MLGVLTPDVTESKNNAVLLNEYEFALERDRLVELENEFQNNQYILSEVNNIKTSYCTS